MLTAATLLRHANAEAAARREQERRLSQLLQESAARLTAGQIREYVNAIGANTVDGVSIASHCKKARLPGKRTFRRLRQETFGKILQVSRVFVSVRTALEEGGQRP